MEKRFNSSNALAPVILVILGALVIGCGGKLEGTTYAGNGGVVQVEFKSGGKAYVSTGPVSTALKAVCSGD
jgi:hypothetical protein